MQKHNESSGSEEQENEAEWSWKSFFIKLFTCQYLRGGSGYELVNVIGNAICIFNILVKFAYDYVSQQTQEKYKGYDGMPDFDTLISWNQFCVVIDCLLFLLVPVSFMKQLITWVPQVFKSTTDLLLAYLNKKQLLLWIVSIYATFAVAMFNKFVMASIYYNIGNEAYSLLRTFVFNVNGFFWEPIVTYGIYEGMERVIKQRGILLTLFCIFFIRLISQYVVFNMMVSQILDYLRTSTVVGAKRNKL